MRAQRVITRPLPRLWQAHLDRIRTKLRASDLLHVLDSFPPATSATIHNGNTNTIRVFLGYRKQGNGAIASSWAYLLVDRRDIIPPVTIRDQLQASSLSESGDQTKLFPRAATSLLRIAEELQAPYRFLQF
jgi:hypothetical protein